MKSLQQFLKKPVPVLVRRYIGSEILYFRACIARKPRAEIERIRQEYKKCLVDVVEYAHQQKNDKVAFEFGDLFREDDDELIDAWSAPM
jgi:predicted SnoaL-like aldol condensation-catalyzing enzyme